MQICKGIEMLGGTGNDSNIYLVDGELLVDTGTGIFFSDIKREIEKKFDINKIMMIVNTHHHFDHTGGNKKFRDWLKANIAIHSADKNALESGKTLAEFFGEKSKIITADKILKNGTIIKTKNFIFEVVHTPGHTPGSICLYEKNKRILISGDTLFSDGIGRTDLPEGDKDQMLSSLKKLLGYNINFLLPGHGTPKLGGIDFLIKRMIIKLKQEDFY
ncbi:MAG: MBL fold metallo-hydrolase [Candidatus Aenigmatarchaeota archaeon]